jgi:hypothetical protein
MKFKLKPLQEITLVLLLISLGALIKNFRPEVFLHFSSTVGFGIILFFILSKITKKKKTLLNTVVTTLIIFLTLHYGFENKDLIYPLALTAIAIFAKFFINIKGSTVINPAVLALLVGQFLLEGTFISWWGTNYNIGPVPIALIILAIWIIFGLKKWRKLPILLTFLITHAAVLLVTGELDFAKFTFTDGTVYFLAAIMLIDPKTSPMLKRDQIIFALIAVIAFNALKYPGIAGFELWTIATANLYFFGTKILKTKKPISS